MTLAQAIDEITESPGFFDVIDAFTRRRQLEQEARDRFTASVQEDVREEFIAGKVVTFMPTRKAHQDVTGAVTSVARSVVTLGVGGFVGGQEALVRLTRNDYLPDVCYWPRSVSRTFTKDQIAFPAPAWVVEVLSRDTARRDRGVKFEDYARHRIAEYWIIDADAEIIEQYRNVDGHFELIKKHRVGTLRSVAIPSMAMPVRAAFDHAIYMRYMKKLWTRK